MKVTGKVYMYVSACRRRRTYEVGWGGGEGGGGGGWGGVGFENGLKIHERALSQILISHIDFHLDHDYGMSIFSFSRSPPKP